MASKHKHNIALGWLCAFFIIAVNAACAPQPVAVRVGNVSLANGQIARGAEMFVGEPAQPFSFLPQWPLNNTFIYGTNGFCILGDDPWTDSGCTTFRGGAYDSLASTTRSQDTQGSYPVDASPFPDMTHVSDTIKISENVSIAQFPLGVPLNDWGAQAYHPAAAIGLGSNSTMLNTLKDSGTIASRTWSFFWGRNGANPSTQIDGGMIFGGYDRAKTSGKNYTQAMSPSTFNCATGLVVAITDMVLNFPNGTNASIFPNSRSSALTACIVPDYPVLLTLALNPYVANSITLTDMLPDLRRSLGVNYFTLRYPDASDPFRGDMTISLQSGLSVRIPNDQLVVPDVAIDHDTGVLVANTTGADLVINAIQDVNADDMSQLGRQFLSAAYVMVNQDANEFTLWSANPTSAQDLVAVDERNMQITTFCQAHSSVTNSSSSPEASVTAQTIGQSTSAQVSTGRIAGTVVGSVIGLFAFGAMVTWLVRNRRRTRHPGMPEAENQVLAESWKIGDPPSYLDHKSELQDTSHYLPSDIGSREVVRDRGHHELAG